MTNISTSSIFKYTNNSNKPIVSILSQFTNDELEGLLTENSSLRGYLQGYLGELALKKQLQQLDGITNISKIPDQGLEKGDLKLEYKGLPITIEVKSVASAKIKPDVLNDSWQGTVLIKNTDSRVLDIPGVGQVKSASLMKGGFDILAICCYAVSNEWSFLFLENEYIPEKSPNIPGLLKTCFPINPATTPLVTNDIFKVLNSVVDKKNLSSAKIVGQTFNGLT